MSEAIADAIYDYESAPDLRTFYKENIAFLEGDVSHEDTQNIPTTPYGINLDIPEYKQWNNAQIAANNGKPLSKEVYLEKGADIFMGYEKDYRTVLGGEVYDSLTTEQKFVIHSAKYNTGSWYKGLGQAMSNYNTNPTAENLMSVYKQSTRVEKVLDKAGNVVMIPDPSKEGELIPKTARNVGMDNRAMKELQLAGLYDPQNVEHQKMAQQVLYEADPSKINPEWSYQQP